MVASLAAALFAALAPSVTAAEPLRFDVGAGRADITPDFPVRLNGFGFRRTESEGVTQKIWTKALAISRPDEAPAILVTADILGFPAEIVEQITTRLAAKAGVERSRVAFAASHTHTAPMLAGANETLFGVEIPAEHRDHIDRYTAQFVDAVEAACLQALARRRPATLAWTIGSVGFAANRRTPGGPVDHDLPLLVVRSIDGELMAVYASYACHCVTLSHNQISGDWAGFAQEWIERAHPGATAMVAIGCGADANPSSGVTGEKVDIARAQGAQIADEVERLLTTALKPIGSPLRIQSQTIALPLDALPTREQWQERVERGGAVGFHAQRQLARLARGETLRTAIDYPIQSWSFGRELAMTFLAGEVVVDFSLRLKRELDGLRWWVQAYANDAPGYIPSERVLAEGGYEGGDAMVYYDQPTRFKPGVEQRIIDAVHQQLGADFQPGWQAERIGSQRPLAPEASRNAIQMRPGMTVELAVAEPLVASPVAISFAAHGGLFVAEMIDYPAGIDGALQPGGRVRLLRDRDGDGRYDTSTTFLDGASFPTDVMAWGRGALVCAAPDILYAEDRDGDDVADLRRVLFTGFGTENFQARVNGLTLGLDGWIYGSCGLIGGRITNERGQTVALGSRDFRMRPQTGELEPVIGSTQQGRPRDDFGNWFGCDNGTFIRHYVLDDAMLSRNPRVAQIDPVAFVPADPHPAHVFSIGKPTLFKLSGPPNTATAACGLTIYRDSLLGEELFGNAFACEPVNHVVHRLVLEPRGATFAGRRAADEQDREFLASSDLWFRPVQAKTGPDGALWIVDMYRYLIEHPRWVPPEDLAEVDERAGHDLGRIYRVYPSDRRPRSIVKISDLAGGDLAAALDSPSGPQRDLAMQRLVDSPEQAPLEELARLAAEAKLPAVRVQAMSTLSQIAPGRAAARRLATAAAADADPRLRAAAIELLARLGADGSSGATALLARTNEPDAAVRMRLAYALGAVANGRDGQPRAAARQLADLVIDADEYVSAAALSSIHERNIGQVLEVWFGGETPLGAVRHGAVIGSRGAGELMKLGALIGGKRELSLLVAAAESRAAANDSDQRAAGATIASAMLSTVDRRQQPLDAELRRRLNMLTTQLRQSAADGSLPAAERVAAVGALGQLAEDAALDSELLAQLLTPQQPIEIQSRAATALGRIAAPRTAELLLAGWSGYPPELRGLVVDLLLSRNEWIEPLVAAMESGAVPASQFDAPLRQRLLQLAPETVHERLRSLIQAGAGDRLAVIESYRPALDLTGDRERGQQVFERRCAQCHRWGTAGHAVGPDLTNYASKPPQALLIAVLDPNQAVDYRFLGYTVVTNDGRVHSGILAGESGGSLVLAAEQGKREVIQRSEIELMRDSGKSLMPEGLERDLSHQDLADLAALIVGAGPPPRVFPGNQPRVVAAVDGRLELPASAAEIYGEQIAFEPEFHNLGMWHGEADLAAWQIDVAADGLYEVRLDWACHDASAGNRFVIESGAASLAGAVPASGGWDRYQQSTAGPIRLERGRRRIVMRPGGPLRGALADVRAVSLTWKSAEGPNELGAQASGASEGTGERAAPAGIDPASLARQILDERQPPALRERWIADHPAHTSELILAMASDLPDDAQEEYRRIPWIWRVAIAAGRRNQDDELRVLLAATLPPADGRLRDWQAVVLGGGVINGVSQQGVWPAERLRGLCREGELAARLDRAIALCEQMADQRATPDGTRYDALRVVALRGWERGSPQLLRYLALAENQELQMGAVSGLVDVDHPGAAQALIERFAQLGGENRELALDGLTRGDRRSLALLEAIRQGKIPRQALGEAREGRLRDHAHAAVRAAAAQVLPEMR